MVIWSISPFENSESQISIIPFLDTPELRSNIESEDRSCSLAKSSHKSRSFERQTPLLKV